MRNWLYILVMALSLYAIRALPMTLIRRPIKSPFLRSFLYYVPYVTLAVMTVPAIIDDPRSPVAGALALAVGIVASWLGAGLMPVAALCCVTVLLSELALL